MVSSLPIVKAPDYPGALGFNAFHFPNWRELQREVVDHVIEWYHTGPKVLMLEAPPGAGKSLIAGAAIRTLAEQHPGFRAVITTQTLSLQRQYAFETLEGMASPAWGRGNHECLVTDTTVDNAPCQHGYKCEVRDKCTYYSQRDAAEAAEISVLNTAFFLNSVNYAKLSHLEQDIPRGRTAHFDKADLYVHDEGHLLEQAIQGFIEERLNRSFFTKLDIKMPRTHEYIAWQEFYAEHSGQVRELALAYDRAARSAAVTGEVPDDPLGRQASRQWRSWQKIMTELLPHRPLIEVDKWGVGFRPVWGTNFAEPSLWNKGNRHLMMSATVFHHQYVAANLGLKPDDYAYVSLPSQFAPMRRRILYDPVLKVTGKTKPVEFQQLVNRMDSYLDRHLDDKSIVHSVSYARAEQVKAMSRHRDRMIVPERGKGKREAGIEMYLAAPPGAILVSPAVGMGEDFGKGDNCRAQFFVKYPVPYLGDPVVKARLQDNPDSLWMEADMSFVQMLGRGMRSEDDYCTNYVLDAGAGWRFAHLPSYIAQAVVRE